MLLPALKLPRPKLLKQQSKFFHAFFRGGAFLMECLPFFVFRGVSGFSPAALLYLWVQCNFLFPAKVAELVDALDLGSSALCVGVQIPPFAP